MADQSPAPSSGMSKKAAIIGAAITAIAASEEWKTQAFIFGIGAIGALVQGALDWRKAK